MPRKTRSTRTTRNPTERYEMTKLYYVIWTSTLVETSAETLDPHKHADFITDHSRRIASRQALVTERHFEVLVQFQLSA
jgi:hypothetical protein